MENITEVKYIDLISNKTFINIIIDRGNGEFTSMPKSVWDELEAAKEANL